MCPDCNPSPIYTTNVNLFNRHCQPYTAPNCANKYTGPDLTCSGIRNQMSIDETIQRIDTQLCGLLGDYSSYNTSCLDDSVSIVTQKQFVETISTTICSLKNKIGNFSVDSFNEFETKQDVRFGQLELPGITSSTIGIEDIDGLQTVLSKITASIDDIINVKLNIGSVDFDQCFVVSSNPTSIRGALDLLVDQICTIKAGGVGSVTLPTFNNTASCLGGILGTADSLEDTINKIKTRLCQTGTFDINALTWGCISKPSSSTTNLQAAFQSVLTKLDTLTKNIPTFSSHFTVSQANSGDACQGKLVTLANSAGNTDRYVGTTSADTTPGTLDNKIQAGTGITLDTNSVAGKMIISSTAVGQDIKVKLNSSDTTSGYLEDKITGSTNSSTGITIGVSSDNSSHKSTINSSLDGAKMWGFLMDILEDNDTLKARFCELVTSCLPDCTIPSNVTVIYNTESTTTSTTTTTAAP